jgi:ABC-2 type transport system permease protein
MRPRIIWAIFRKDVLDGIRNYQVLLIILTPIFLSLLFNSLYRESKVKTMLPKIGVIGLADHPLLKKFREEDSGVKLLFYQTRQDLDAKIIEGEIGFGVILPATLAAADREGNKSKLVLVYPAGLPGYTVERMQITLEQQIRQCFHLAPPPLPIDIEMSPVGGDKAGDHAFSNDFFPMLMLMAMGMVGFLAMPLSFVEEKEKRTIHALFLTPIRSGELIIGKSLFGLCLILGTIGTMILVNQRFDGNWPYLWAFVLLGALQCLFIGLLVAIFAKSQGSVNAFGTATFMMFQLVPNLSQSSELMRAASTFVPSTYIGRGLKKALFLDLSKVDIHGDLAVVASCCLVAYLAVFLCLRFRRHEI